MLAPCGSWCVRGGEDTARARGVSVGSEGERAHTWKPSTRVNGHLPWNLTVRAKAGAAACSCCMRSCMQWYLQSSCKCAPSRVTSGLLNRKEEEGSDVELLVK